MVPSPSARNSENSFGRMYSTVHPADCQLQMYSTSCRLPVTDVQYILQTASYKVQFRSTAVNISDLNVTTLFNITSSLNCTPNYHPLRCLLRKVSTRRYSEMHKHLTCDWSIPFCPLHSNECPDITAEVTASFVTDILQCWNGQCFGMAWHVAGWGKTQCYLHESAHVELPFPTFTQNKIRTHRRIRYKGWASNNPCTTAKMFYFAAQTQD